MAQCVDCTSNIRLLKNVIASDRIVRLRECHPEHHTFELVISSAGLSSAEAHTRKPIYLAIESRQNTRTYSVHCFIVAD